MNVNDKAEIFHLHLHESFVAKDAGIVHENVDTAPLLHGRVNHGANFVSFRYIGAVGDRFTARIDNLLDDRFRRRERRPGAIARAAQIVDDDFRAARGESERMRSAKTAACAGYDCNFSVEADSHASPSQSSKLTTISVFTEFAMKQCSCES